jgi:hypothetical protein
VPDIDEPTFGANSWLVEEMYEQFKADPESVGEAWKEFFVDYRSGIRYRPLAVRREVILPSTRILGIAVHRALPLGHPSRARQLGTTLITTLPNV